MSWNKFYCVLFVSYPDTNGFSSMIVQAKDIAAIVEQTAEFVADAKKAIFETTGKQPTQVILVNAISLGSQKGTQHVEPA